MFLDGLSIDWLLRIGYGDKLRINGLGLHGAIRGKPVLTTVQTRQHLARWIMLTGQFELRRLNDPFSELSVIGLSGVGIFTAISHIGSDRDADRNFVTS